jgi:hypothetical protein
MRVSPDEAQPALQARSKGDSVYIGIGTLIVILIIVLLIAR